MKKKLSKYNNYGGIAVKRAWEKRLWLPSAAALGGGALAAGLWTLKGSGAPGLLGEVSQWLRRLSLSGAAGDLAAWAIVLGVSALPALGLLWRGRRRADWLLLLAGAELLAGLYFLVNPTLVFPAELAGIPALEQVWGLAAFGCVASTLAAWVLLRLLGSLEGAPARLLPGVLRWAAVIYGFLAGASTVLDALREVEKVAAGNTAETRVMISAALSWAVAAIELIPSLLGAWVLLWGGELARALDRAPFQEETVALAETISRRCALVARLSLLTAVGCNLLQFICVPVAASVSFSVYLPVGTLALCGMLLLLCQYFRRAKAVRDDNDSII